VNRRALRNRETDQDYNSWGCIHNGTPAHGTVSLATDGSPGKEILAILGSAVEVEYDVTGLLTESVGSTSGQPSTCRIRRCEPTCRELHSDGAVHSRSMQTVQGLPMRKPCIRQA